MAVIFNPAGSQGGMIWQDSSYPWKIYGGIGEGIRSWALRPGLPCDDTTGDPTELNVTVVEAGGGGDTTVTPGLVEGYPLLITTDNAEYDGANVQLKGSLAMCSADKPWYLRGVVKASVEKLSDLLFGMCIQKTDLCKTSSAHGVLATNVEGVFFFKVAGASETTIYLKSYVAGAEKSSVAVGTLAKVDIDLALMWDGVYVHAYIDDVEVAKIAGDLPTLALTPSINFRTGASAAITLSVAELAFVSVE
jgi:hypothetical protein